MQLLDPGREGDEAYIRIATDREPAAVPAPPAEAPAIVRNVCVSGVMLHSIHTPQGARGAPGNASRSRRTGTRRHIVYLYLTCPIHAPIRGCS